jgi:hypothetical protein
MSTPPEWWFRKTAFERNAFAAFVILSFALSVFLILRLFF